MEPQVLCLPFPPSVNNLFANRPRGGRYPTKAYRDWQTEAGWHLAMRRDRRVLPGPYHILFEVGRPDRRKRDLSNLWKAPEDLLVKHGVIEDDSQVATLQFKWVDDLKGCRVTITSAQMGVAA